MILSLAAVGTAWATFQASQWSSAENTDVSRSTAVRSQAIQATSQATRTEQVDTALWLQWLSALTMRQLF